ncbi:hypothetical protein HDIA_2237 [Hartmannibacter diazotrophicus]|uniref:ORC1/DEAH AAA+ ATPase domain-containing protein n=1 Tax=Hartmannibacter diazotrophicus TaxID=1482074 RepID=A0A2C9D6K8_9HYPH|nr:AAA family ATPase [Hartmannibacter diazotrophicus]SON55778.1 hypothetical protein HDIA_2237 [Hartmannibacter diazotrophicus]
MRKDFVFVSNTQNFFDGVDRVEKRGAAEKILMVVDGQPGHGKTTTAEWYAAEHGLPFIRAKAEWTPHWMLQELLETLELVPERGFPKMYKQATVTLGARMSYARDNGHPFALIVDEVDHMVRSSKQLETLRDIGELIEMPIILIGMSKLWDGLNRLPQIRSRASAHVTFMPLSKDDTRSIVGKRCECEVADDLIDVLDAAAKGYPREVMDGIQAIERVGKRLGRPVTVSDMAGEILLTDRATGKAVMVKPS